MEPHDPSSSGTAQAATAIRRPNPRQSSAFCRVQTIPAALLAALSTLVVAPAQRPAWVPLSTAASTVYELSTYDPGIGRPLAIASSSPVNPTPPGLLVEWNGWSWCGRLSTVVPTYPTNTPHGVGDHKLVFDVARRMAVLVNANLASQPPSTWQWNGIDWAAVTTPTSLPPTSCIASLSYHGRAGAEEVLAVLGGQVWGFDGSDWRYRTALPFDATYGVWVPTANVHLFGVRSGPWQGSMVAWNGTAVVPVTFTGYALPDGAGSGARMVFDSVRGKLVMVCMRVSEPSVTCEGAVAVGPGGLTVNWAQIGAGAQLRVSGNLVYDDAHERAIVFGGGIYSLFPAELPSSATSWFPRAQLDPLLSPRLAGHSCVYDQQRQYMLTFGGRDQNMALRGETRIFDIHAMSWQSNGVDPAVAARVGAGLVYIASTGQTLMFGGTDDSTGPRNDWWLWNGAAWTSALAPGPRPSPRFGHCMVFDPARNRVVLFGGFDGNSPFGDTWEFDPVTLQWQQIATPVQPSPRWGAKMVYDVARNRLVLFGGNDGFTSNYSDETWVYGGPAAGWSQLMPATRPPGRFQQAMEYDPRRNRVVLFGGFVATPQPAADHWEFDSVNWVQRPSAPAVTPNAISTPFPEARAYASMVWDQVAQAMVLFGGYTSIQANSATSSMWMFDAPTDSFGMGQSSGGTSLRLLRPAVAGHDLALEFDSPSQFGWLAVHLVTEPAPTHFVDPPLACSSRAWFYGLNPIVATIGGNPGRLQFPLPTWVLGLGMNFQAIAFDAAGPCLSVSDPLAVQVR